MLSPHTSQSPKPLSYQFMERVAELRKTFPSLTTEDIMAMVGKQMKEDCPTKDDKVLLME